MTTVRRVGVMSIGKVSLVTGGFLGVVVGGLYFLILLFTGSPLWALAALFASIIGYGGFSFLAGILYACLYNVVAGWVGGIKIELS